MRLAAAARDFLNGTPVQLAPLSAEERFAFLHFAWVYPTYMRRPLLPQWVN